MHGRQFLKRKCNTPYLLALISSRGQQSNQTPYSICLFDCKAYLWLSLRHHCKRCRARKLHSRSPILLRKNPFIQHESYLQRIAFLWPSHHSLSKTSGSIWIWTCLGSIQSCQCSAKLFPPSYCLTDAIGILTVSMQASSTSLCHHYISVQEVSSNGRLGLN